MVKATTGMQSQPRCACGSGRLVTPSGKWDVAQSEKVKGISTKIKEDWKLIGACQLECCGCPLVRKLCPFWASPPRGLCQQMQINLLWTVTI
eukprot:4099385-Amphidinium_carterae.2